ncbi:hypothetical protein CH306_05560 [Rhodococcus sp. 15-725-2-2b]|uniref:DUF6461 domain-containing protein n=1 Tax=unclassified Rhodococcus (in: high G+C Gram-positive bacteria) TaxID=192944 RepID=UPI000B9ABC66|nr:MULTISPECIES: DUF6461 domain-containing protein [unclassified Rhodococcus (in: high G+C Gram-positive bacteria)]OZC62464.1 hypothetical protein CH277_24675 [Rhodococcus sp. 06-469-3-2]OZD49973.1 hypothetical protein CH264_02890 [Rhodococcus sp. 06-1477-1A]OZE76415.1 hypothetical protein CH306_05560 [Rhodococcus sp. 15-725-2-2b]
MAATWQDFSWVVDDYEWVETSVSFTFVRHDDPASVLAALTTEIHGTVVGLDGVNSDVDMVGVTQLGNWVLAVAPSTAGLADELMAPLSMGGEALTCAITVGPSYFAQWVDGRGTAFFDSLLKSGPGFDDPNSPWRQGMRVAGVDPNSEGPLPDGRFHVLETSLAMIANHTGVAITPELLRSASFHIGDSIE